jgi:site-specific DNA-methyltransferase (adenine-specific)
MTLNKGLMSSKRQDYKTPKNIYAELDKEFCFDFDPCLISTDTIHNVDMLGSDWGGEKIFVNPPYKYLGKWINKCFNEWKKGKLIVMLIPARTDTKAFHEYIYPYAELRFIKGRLCFDDSGKPAPFPSMIVIFNRNR